MALCRGCQAPIGWVRLKGGAAHPVQTEEAQIFHIYTRPVAGAGRRLVLITEEGDTVTCYVAPVGRGFPVKAFESHFPACPEAESLRRRPRLR